MIRIIRENCFNDSLRKYKVILDKTCIGDVSNGETKEFNISQGKHELYLKIDWCQSPMY